MCDNGESVNMALRKGKNCLLQFVRDNYDKTSAQN